jgi:hypothetical protein
MNRWDFREIPLRQFGSPLYEFVSIHKMLGRNVKLRRLLLVACSVGAVVGLVATASEILLDWDRSVAVLDAPDEQVASLTATELNNKVAGGEITLRSLRGAEKEAYILRHSPMALILGWVRFFVPSTLAALLSGVLICRRHSA